MGTSTTIKIVKGVHGVNKLCILNSQTKIQHTGVKGHCMPDGIAVLFQGDRIEAYGVDAEVMRLQEPDVQARCIASRFPNTWATVVISPSRTEAGAACFDHFFEKLTLTGEPLGYKPGMFKASSQLCSLLMNSGLLVSDSVSDDLASNARKFPPCVVIGFSKGGIVLNQLLTEMAGCNMTVSSDQQPGQMQRCPSSASCSAELLQSITEFHFLDTGLNCRGAHLTDSEIISALGAAMKEEKDKSIADVLGNKKKPILYLHGTPRQWTDARRPFIAAERDTFIQLCEKNDVSINSKYYFEGQKPSLRMHFDILTAWQR